MKLSGLQQQFLELELKNFSQFQGLLKLAIEHRDSIETRSVLLLLEAHIVFMRTFLTEESSAHESIQQ